MNSFFGGQLRRELIDLMGRSELLRKRVNSTGSYRLSSDSGRPGEDDEPLSTAMALATEYYDSDDS
jgi:hypothetical protein